jgi:hypothetical protein
MGGGGEEEEAQVNPTQTEHLRLSEFLAILRQAPNRHARKMPPFHVLAHDF